MHRFLRSIGFSHINTRQDMDKLLGIIMNEPDQTKKIALSKNHIYTEFTKDIDTVLMGWNTSHQVVTELSPQEWVYNKFTTYVLTHKECNSSQQIHFTSENPVLLLERLKQEAGKDIWICGGANLVQQLVSKNMIDKYYISVIPTLLGNGVRLLGNIDREIKLRLCKTQTYNGITDLIYMRR